MEQQQQQTSSPEPSTSPQPKASPELSAPRGRQRCQARNRDRSQCRLHAQDLATGLCSRHAALALKNATAFDDTTDLAMDLLDSAKGALDSTYAINLILTNVILLVAQGRLSPRRASVITFALSLMLRSVVVADSEAANQPVRHVFNDSWEEDTKDESATSTPPSEAPKTEAPPLTSHEAMENYARLRT
jgi:hypothetical protein